MGGVPIFLGAAFSLFIWFPGPYDEFKYLIAALMLMFVVGLRDDLVPLPANLKLASQLIPFILLINWGDFKLISLYNIAPGVVFPEPVAWIITLFVLIVITNSINLIDGLDGLAGTLGVIIMAFYGIWFMIAGFPQAAYVCFAVIGGLIAFLFFNWQPSRIFMGDTGALTLGLLSAAMTILFINYNYSLAAANPAKLPNGVAMAVCVMIIPLTDTLRVFIIRISNGRSPFSADKNHLHHLLLRTGLSHSAVVKLFIAVNLLFISLCLAGQSWSTPILLMTVTALATACVFSVILYIRIKFGLKSKPQKAAV